ncbi:hypothetical protein F8M41_020419 [Gigaspora margarita]|uniref:Uncharacterized protein n=1 Tax=Gigaspora margarita TaxID=4874 RepID=A0A8H4ETV2_GIGMA|nr:hypothetical protein F8M41_020419 [Gigaspora margarita]
MGGYRYDNKENSEDNCEDHSNNESDEFIDDGTSDALKTQSSDDFTRAVNIEKFCLNKDLDSWMTKKNGSLNQSYAFDSEDRYVQSGFTQDELTVIVEITTSSQELQIEEDLLYYINTFVKDSTKDIHEALYAPHPKFCCKYDPFI